MSDDDDLLLENVWRDLEWLPEELVAKWVMGVKDKHERNGWGSMPGILWDVDTFVFLGFYPSTMEMLKIATHSWRPSRRHEYQTYLVSIVLAIECLGCDFAGWGDRYPLAKQKAVEILDQFFLNSRTRLLDVYMPLRDQIPSDRIRKGFGPPG